MTEVICAVSRLVVMRPPSRGCSSAVRLQQARFALRRSTNEWTAWIYLVIRTVQSLYRRAQVDVPAVHPHCRNSAVS
jgi:hypothetical protein